MTTVYYSDPDFAAPLTVVQPVLRARFFATFRVSVPGVAVLRLALLARQLGRRVGPCSSTSSFARRLVVNHRFLERTMNRKRKRTLCTLVH